MGRFADPVAVADSLPPVDLSRKDIPTTIVSEVLLPDAPVETSQVRPWQTLVTKKRDENKTKTPKEWLLAKDALSSLDAGPTKGKNLIELEVVKKSGILTQHELDITENYTATELVAKLASGHLSSLEVTTAFCKRAAIGQQLLSCLTEVFYSDALERARYVDEYFKREGKVIGPLHGLPISVKDSFCITGQQTTVGWTSFLKHPALEFNSPAIQMLLDAGAVLYVKTNIPQTMMTGDSENNIFGRTLNPHNTGLTAGGSSGGEGSLVAFRGSVLGLGTDIAGSIRIPALCCGVYGFKPTTNRIPFARQVSGAMEGLPGPVPSAGPLAHSLDDIELFMQTILTRNPEDYDSSAHAVPWRSITHPPTTKLRIGVLPEEKVFPLQPPIRRTLQKTVKALSEQGHEIIYLPLDESTSVSLGNRLTFSYYILGPDPSSEHFEGPEAEPPVTSVAQRSHPMFSGPFPVSPETEPFTKINELAGVRQKYNESWRQMWVDNKLDVLLSPAAQNTAVPHDTYGWPPYTQVWNILDYPACVIPCFKSSKIDDPCPDPNDDFGPQPNYNPEAQHGAPCSIQLVTRRFEDEKLLAAAKVVDSVLKQIQSS